MFRFTIRDVLWLTVVVALAVGWWRDNCLQKSLNYRAEMETWKGRTEILKRHVERSGESVSWRRNERGNAEEIVIGSNGKDVNYERSLVGDDRAPLSLRPWEATSGN
jgi:hypothetical protein